MKTELEKFNNDLRKVIAKVKNGDFDSVALVELKTEIKANLKTLERELFL